jgi:transporter family protein
MMVAPWLFWAALSALFAALMTILAKAGLRGIDPDFAQLIRTAVIFPTLAAFVLVTGKWQNMAGWNARTWTLLVLSGLATGASWVCYFRALNVGESSRVAAVDKLSFVIVAILATTLFRERLGLASWCGIGLIAAGLSIVCVSK